MQLALELWTFAVVGGTLAIIAAWAALDEMVDEDFNAPMEFENTHPHRNEGH